MNRVSNRFRPSLAACATLAAALDACGGGQAHPAAAPAPPPLPAFAIVEFRGALIAPTKVNGAPWDGPGPLAEDAPLLIAEALAKSNPYAAVASVFANPAIAALDKPEPFGDAKVMSGPFVLQDVPLESHERDTLTPIWSGATAARLPLTEATHIEVALWDRDLAEDDAMGTATVTYPDLVAALRAGTVYHVPMAELTHNQVLFLDVSAYSLP